MSEKYFPSKKEIFPQIYAYELPNDVSRIWQLKVWYTDREDVNVRIKEQIWATHLKYIVKVAESAMREDWTNFLDYEVHDYLEHVLKKENTDWERFICNDYDVKAAILWVKERKFFKSWRFETFKMRPEQEKAVEKTAYYFRNTKESAEWWKPRFLWNAKMRFGKTFTAYQLALRMWWTKILVLTFKPAVERAWEDDLNNHIDFEWWQFISKKTAFADQLDKNRPFVCFGSFQDFLWKDEYGNIKPSNKRVHETHWDVVIFDEYHFWAWRENAKWLFDVKEDKSIDLDDNDENIDILNIEEAEKNIPIETDHYLYLSWTPFRAINNWEFIEEQIYNWTYSDEQKAKKERDYSKWENPYEILPQIVMMTYQLPDNIKMIAQWWEFDEFDLNEFFKAEWKWDDAHFIHENEVQNRLDLIRWVYSETTKDDLKLWRNKPAFPFSDVRLLWILTHTLRFLPNVASCDAMYNLMQQRQNTFYQWYEIIVAAWTKAWIWVDALKPVEKAMKDPLKTKTITLSCGKLTTWVTVRPRSWVLMLRNLKTPETYFQTAFRVQSPRTIKNPDWKSPNKIEILKEICYILDFAPNRALTQISEYSGKLNPEIYDPEEWVRDFIKFLPVLAYDWSSMKEIDATGILDMVASGTTATLLARKWESALLVNVDNITLNKLLSNPEILGILEKIEWFRSLNKDIETIINKSESVKAMKEKAKNEQLSPKEKKEMTAEEKAYKSKRKEIQEKLIKFATRIPIFMYLTDNREKCLKDLITQVEPELFKKVTWLAVKDFELLVSLWLFNGDLMNQAVYSFKRYEDSSLEYSGINRHELEEKVWWFDQTITVDEFYAPREASPEWKEMAINIVKKYEKENNELLKAIVESIIANWWIWNYSKHIYPYIKSYYIDLYSNYKDWDHFVATVNATVQRYTKWMDSFRWTEIFISEWKWTWTFRLKDF